MKYFILTLLSVFSLSNLAQADVQSFPKDFRIEDIKANGVEIHTRVGGTGAAVVLIHGFGDTGDMWVPLATSLAKDHTVIVPDLRGMGLSSVPADGYEKWNQAADIRGVLDYLKIDKAVIIGHDIGTMVAYAYAARYSDKTEKLAVMDAPVPGITPWNDIVRDPRLWHFDIGGKDIERLVAGRERIYLDRFWNDFAGDPSKVDEATREHYAKIYADEGRMHAAFNQFNTIRKDAEKNKDAMKTPLTMPVLAVGGQKSFGAMEAIVMRNAAKNVTEVVIPNAGHWLMEEAPQQTTDAVQKFINQK